MTNVTVHSTAEPYAEAMIVEDGVVAWVGSEETAERLRDERSVVEDGGAALAAPAFFGWLRRPVGTSAAELEAALDAAAEGGTATLRLVIDGLDDQDPEALTAAATLLGIAAEHPVTIHPVLELTDAAARRDGSAARLADAVGEREAGSDAVTAIGLPTSLWSAEDPGASILPVALRCAEDGRQLVLSLPQGAAPSTVVHVVTGMRRRLIEEAGRRPPADRPTVLFGFDSPDIDDWEALIGTGVHVVLYGPGHLSAALKAGVPTSAAPGEGQCPWELVSAHVHRAEDPVSVRAAFNAQVRGAHRMVSGQPAGQLNPGSAATYALWDVDSLAVQTPDSRTAAWSTDARARTPLLPYLDGTELPRVRRTVIAGHTVVRAPAAETVGHID